MSIWQSFFGWPAGGVWSNLIASAITGAGTVAATLWRVRRHHETTRRENAEHREQLAEHVTRQIATLQAKLDRQQGGGQ